MWRKREQFIPIELLESNAWFVYKPKIDYLRNINEEDMFFNDNDYSENEDKVYASSVAAYEHQIINQILNQIQ